jgi:hypothetical protein
LLLKGVEDNFISNDLFGFSNRRTLLKEEELFIMPPPRVVGTARWNAIAYSFSDILLVLVLLLVMKDNLIQTGSDDVTFELEI